MHGYDRQSLTTTTELAAVAELAYAAANGSPRVEAVTPLLLGGDPTFALPYSRLELARRLAEVPRVSVTFSDSRLAYVGWSPLTVEGAVEVTPDPEGELFLGELLTDELRKFRPARSLIGNFVARRDHWWYVPRLILRLKDAGPPRPVARRTAPEHAVLAWNVGGTVRADVVRVDDWQAERIAVRPLPPDAAGPAEPLPDGVPAALFRNDFSVPDMEQRASLLVSGRLEGRRLTVERLEGEPQLGRRPGTLGRWRAQMDLARRCKAGLKDPRWGEG